MAIWHFSFCSTGRAAVNQISGLDFGDNSYFSVRHILLLHNNTLNYFHKTAIIKMFNWAAFSKRKATWEQIIQAAGHREITVDLWIQESFLKQETKLQWQPLLLTLSVQMTYANMISWWMTVQNTPTINVSLIHCQVLGLDLKWQV